MSFLTTLIAALQTIPGFLLSGTRRHASNALIPDGDTGWVQIRLATPAMASHRLVDVSLKEEHIRRHVRASTLDGPAEPLQCRAVLLIMLPSMASQMTGSAGRALGKVLDKSASLARGFPLGCSDSRMFRTDSVVPSLVWMISSSLRGKPEVFRDRKLRAPCTFPRNIILPKARETA